MSFILDALKKADAERHVGELPGLRSLPAARSPVAGRRRGWRWPTLAGGFVLVAASTVFLMVWKHDQHPAASWAAPESAAVDRSLSPSSAGAAARRTPGVDATNGTDPVALATPPNSAIAAATSVATLSMPTSTSTSAPTSTSTSTPTSTSTSTPTSAPTVKPLAPPLVATEIPVPPSLPVAVKPASPAKPAAAGQPADLLTLAQLPPSIRAELPSLVIGGSMYSKNPADRMLLLDKRMLHEGDEIAPGLLLESIQPKSAILRYKGSVFRLSL